MSDFFLSPGFDMFGNYNNGSSDSNNPNDDDIDVEDIYDEYAEAQGRDESEEAPPPVPRVQYNSPELQSGRASRQPNRRTTLDELQIQAARNMNQFARDGGPRVPLPPEPAERYQRGVAERLLSNDPETQLDDASELTPTAARRPNGNPNPEEAPPDNRTIIVDGRRLTLKNRPTDHRTFISARLWDKELRGTLNDEARQIFVKSATGYVLSKHNKLSAPSLSSEDDDKLEELHNLKLQLKLLKTHMRAHDTYDVFQVVIPHDVAVTPTIYEQRFDLLTDYSKLTATMVASSNTWYNLWIHQDYIRENMAFTFSLLQNNTNEVLWNKALEEYEAYLPVQQGGPLMFYLIVSRIQNNSETAIDHLKTKIKNLKIKDLKGEDVEKAVSLVRSTHDALLHFSADHRSYVPEDFSQTVLKLFQTSSVTKFNNAFEREETEARHKADKFGGTPTWPPINQILNLATSTYRRLTYEGEWDVPTGSQSSAFKAGSSQSKKRKVTCWNCGKDHTLNDCDQPRNEPRIAKAREEYMKKKKSSGKGKSKPKHKTVDGKPMILNKNGAYVLDQKKMREAQAKDGAVALLDQLTKSAQPDSSATTPSPASALPAAASASAPAPSPATDSALISITQAQLESIRKAITRE